MSTIVTEKGLLEAIPAITRRQLGRLRRQGKIPHIRLGCRSLLYDSERVVEALKKLEVNEKGTATK